MLWIFLKHPVVSSEDTIVPNTGENNMEVANDLSINIDDGTEVSLPEMSQFFLNPPINNESNMFTSNNDGIYPAQQYSSGRLSKKLICIIHHFDYRFG